MNWPTTRTFGRQQTAWTLTQSNRGSVIVSALIFAAIMGITIAFTSTYVSDRVKQTRGTAEKMDSRVVLDSVLAYTTNGIKQTWCFSTSWMQDPSCDLNHPRNTERMLLSDETLTYIASTPVPRPANIADVRLLKIEQTVNLENILSNHPLYLILSPLRDRFTSVSISIVNESSAIQTTKGREVPLRITIKLIPRGTETKAQEISSKVYAYPREVSYFALMLPKDLYLGSTAMKPGDNSFEAVEVISGSGLRFESPVFVNDNLHLPSQGSGMKNVTFADKVYLGGGFIRQAGKLFYPRTAGGTEGAYNHDLPEFKGLLSGYELDTQRDEGMDYLFNLVTVPKLDEEAFDLCKARVAAAYDLEQTKSTQLYTKLVSEGYNEFRLQASVGRIDNLVEQKHSQYYQIYTDVPGVTNAGNIMREGGSVFKVKVIYDGLQNPTNPASFGTYRTEFYVSRSTDASIYPIGNTSATSPRIDIKTSPRYIGGNSQFNEVDLKVTFTNPNNLVMGAAKTGSIHKSASVQIVLEAFDYGYTNAVNQRPYSTSSYNPAIGPYKVNGFIFTKTSPNAGQMDIKKAAANVWYADPTLSDKIKILSAKDSPNDVDYVAFDEQCFQMPEDDDAYFMSFGASDWSTSFVKKARKSWSFFPEYDGSEESGKSGGYNSGTEILGDNFVPGTSPASFHVMSLINKCVIPSNVNFVAGFYTCESLEIQARATPLRIIGTFIVGKIRIDPTAYKAGIRWSNIYHPSAAYELRAAGILGKLANNGGTVNCSSTLPPLWMPNAGVKTVLSHFACNPVSLRKADPFKWSTIDPDCALDEPSGKVKCKKRVTRFLIKEVTRSGAR